MSTLYEKCYRLYRVAGRTLIKYSGNPRPASFPYISGDGFRTIGDHIYDSTRPNFAPEKVKEKEIVFVGDNMIKKFLREIHPRISVRYILVTHNGDERVDEEVAALLDLDVDNKIIKCYSYNVTVSHPKIVPIPLGIENKHFYVQGIPFFLKSAARKAAAHPELKKDRIFYRFTLSANADETRTPRPPQSGSFSPTISGSSRHTNSPSRPMARASSDISLGTRIISALSPSSRARSSLTI